MINLLPGDIKQNSAFAKRNNFLRNFCTYIGLILVLSGSIYGYQYMILEKDLKSAKNIYDEKSLRIVDDKTTQEAQKLSSTITTATTLLNKERKFSVFIKQVGSLMPTGAYLSSLNLTNDTKQPLQIEAVALSESQGLVIKKNIEEITDINNRKIFNGADIQSITATKIKQNNIEILRYTIKITTAFADKPITTQNTTKPEQAKSLTSEDLIGEKKK